MGLRVAPDAWVAAMELGVESGMAAGHCGLAEQLKGQGASLGKDRRRAWS